MSQFLLAIILLLPVFVETKESWSYDNIALWSQTNHYCQGNRQSPINLQFNISHYDDQLQHIYLEKQSPRNQVYIKNNGHSAELKLSSHYIMKNVVSNNEDYIVEQVHFHWGSSDNNSTGSEHLLDDKSYPLEMHIVTYSSAYRSISEAMSNVRALAVLGVFFELSNEPNLHFQLIIDALAHIHHINGNASVSKDFDLSFLFKKKGINRYYRYDGSLTTPPCYETVLWSVLQEPLPLSSDQLRAFHSLHGQNGKLLKNTYRPPGKIGNRKLFRSFGDQHSHDDKPKERVSTKNNHGQHVSINIKIVFILITFIMIIV